MPPLESLVRFRSLGERIDRRDGNCQMDTSRGLFQPSELAATGNCIIRKQLVALEVRWRWFDAVRVRNATTSAHPFKEGLQRIAPSQNKRCVNSVGRKRYELL